MVFLTRQSYIAERRVGVPSLIKMVEKMTDHTVIFKKSFGVGSFRLDENKLLRFLIILSNPWVIFGLPKRTVRSIG